MKYFALTALSTLALSAMGNATPSGVTSAAAAACTNVCCGLVSNAPNGVISSPLVSAIFGLLGISPTIGPKVGAFCNLGSTCTGTALCCQVVISGGPITIPPLPPLNVTTGTGVPNPFGHHATSSQRWIFS